MTIRKVTILGAGLMGHALAVVHAIGNLEVSLYDTNADQLQKSRGLIGQIFNTLDASGALPANECAKALARIQCVAELTRAVEHADLVVEAVTEKPQIKQLVYDDIDRHAPLEAIIASNTSYLDIFPFIAARRQAKALIAHWYTPPYIIDLVEIVPGKETRPDVVSQMAALYAGMGKHPIVFKKFIPGYIANRLQSALNLEVFRLLEEDGFSAEDIDGSIRHGLALRLCLLGQLKKADFTGLEMVRNGLASRAYSPPPVTGKSAVLDSLISAGHTGIFAGKGFYDYGNIPAETLIEQRDRQLIALKRSLSSINGEQSS